MSKILFQITYEIKPDQRDMYRRVANQLRREMQNLGLTYNVYEVQGTERTFTEVFTCNSQEEFDALEDSFSDTAHMLIDRLADLVEGKMRYSTLTEAS